jgi:hypothetical protein
MKMRRRRRRRRRRGGGRRRRMGLPACTKGSCKVSEGAGIHWRRE